ncbi:hypothetical protein EGR_10412 [Echinococcus granulosus]|uniref:Uncharacterized protein n=1 Tax=Echinococcus granulosus TaxID=6210 RepID=W6U2F4_ECHGR|nr:hypothetical protein EGR_10412 [Echinococcus granulosus]EUB54731.1 hypothetical protein EGR_10412 [Echinococcus granulosus]
MNKVSILQPRNDIHYAGKLSENSLTLASPLIIILKGCLMPITPSSKRPHKMLSNGSSRILLLATFKIPNQLIPIYSEEDALMRILSKPLQDNCIKVSGTSFKAWSKCYFFSAIINIVLNETNIFNRDLPQVHTLMSCVRDDEPPECLAFLFRTRYDQLKLSAIWTLRHLYSWAISESDFNLACLLWKPTTIPPCFISTALR